MKVGFLDSLFGKKEHTAEDVASEVDATTPNLDAPAFNADAAPIHVTDDTFDELVLSSSVPALVDFWAPWCGPCRMIAPIVEDLARAYDGD